MFSKRNKFKNECLVGNCRMTGGQLKASSDLRLNARCVCVINVSSSLNYVIKYGCVTECGIV